MPTSSTPVSARARSIAALAAATRSKAPRKPCTCSGLPFGRNGREPGPEAERLDQVQHVEHERRLVVAREGVLHEHDAARALGLVAAPRSASGVAMATPRAASSRRRSTPDNGGVATSPTARSSARPGRRPGKRVVDARHPRHQRQQGLERADQVVAQRPQVAAVVELQELRAEGSARPP